MFQVMKFKMEHATHSIVPSTVGGVSGMTGAIAVLPAALATSSAGGYDATKGQRHHVINML